MDPRSPTSSVTLPGSTDGTTMGDTVGAYDPATPLPLALMVCDDPIPLQQLPPPDDAVHNHGEQSLHYPAIQPAVNPIASRW